MLDCKASFRGANSVIMLITLGLQSEHLSLSLCLQSVGYNHISTHKSILHVAGLNLLTKQATMASNHQLSHGCMSRRDLNLLPEIAKCYAHCRPAHYSQAHYIMLITSVA